MSETWDLADRYAGTLLGLACGDALGGPVEFRTREEIAAEFPAGVIEFVGGGWLDLAPGEVTDDTQQTLILGEALNERGGARKNCRSEVIPSRPRSKR